MSFGGILLWILGGLGVTLQVTACAFALAAPFAFAFGILEYRTAGPSRWLVTAWIEFWRSSSVILLLFFFFYVLPTAGIRLSPLVVGSMVIGCSIGAHGSQAVRGTLATLPPGQVEAALSLGLTRRKALWLVEIPQAFRTMLPIFGNEVVELIKTTANVSLITMSDMTFRAKEAMHAAYKPVQVYGGLILVYVVLCGFAALLTAALVRRIDRAWAR